MAYRPIQWARQSVEGRQIEADGSKLSNYYAVNLPAPEESKVAVMLYQVPGLRRWARVPTKNVLEATPTTGIHALISMNSPAYGRRLYGLSSQYQLFRIRQGSGEDIEDSYDPFGTDSVFAVPSANVENFTLEAADALGPGQPGKLVTDTRRIMWVSPDEVFCWDLGKMGGEGPVTIAAPTPTDTSTLEDLTDQKWVDCEWADGYFFLLAESGQFFHSLYDSIEFDQLDFATAQSHPDKGVALAVLNRRLHVLGEESIEQWYNAGGADFAFSRNNSYTVNIGCAARATVQVDQSFITFLGNDRTVYSISSNGVARISTAAVEYDISQSDPALAWAVVYTEEGHRFYSLTLTFDDSTRKNWTFDFMTRLWHERGETGILCSAEWRNRQTLVGMVGRHHLFDMRLDWGIFENDDDSVADSSITSVGISPALFASFRRGSISSFLVDIPIRSGGDSTDNVLLEWSDDGGKTWVGGTALDGSSKARRLDDGPRFRWNRLGEFRSGRNFRLTTVAKRRVDVLGAYTEAEIRVD